MVAAAIVTQLRRHRRSQACQEHRLPQRRHRSRWNERQWRCADWPSSPLFRLGKNATIDKERGRGGGSKSTIEISSMNWLNNKVDNALDWVLGPSSSSNDGGNDDGRNSINRQDDEDAIAAEAAASILREVEGITNNPPPRSHHVRQSQPQPQPQPCPATPKK
jgi:hypothetical protein